MVSRGGVSGWYAGLAASYADVFSYFSPEEFRAATEESKKQRRERAFDAAVIERVIAAHGLGRPSLLHPGMMYRLLMPFWKGAAPASRADRYAAHARIAVEDDPVLRQLPPTYAAARFYFSDCFPDTPSNRALVASVLETIGRDQPVVLLNTPFALDDHRDAATAGGRVIALDATHMSPERNLAVQTAVIARARLFAGTYGGYRISRRSAGCRPWRSTRSVRFRPRISTSRSACSSVWARLGSCQSIHTIFRSCAAR